MTHAARCLAEDTKELPSAKIAREISELYGATLTLTRQQSNGLEQVDRGILRSFKTWLFQLQQDARIFENDNWFKNTGIYREAIAHLKQLQDWLVYTREIMADESLKNHISALHDTVCVRKNYNCDETGRYHNQFLELEDQWMRRWGVFTDPKIQKFTDVYATKLEQIREAFVSPDKIWVISAHVWDTVASVVHHEPEPGHPQLNLFP